MPHKKDDPVKHCEICGAVLTRKRYNGRLEDRNTFLRRSHCSLTCANSRREVQTNTHRKRARQIMPRETCEECGTTERLHVHHIDRTPSNNDPANLSVLCTSCHMKLHWREDYDKRVAAIRAAVRPGVNTRPRSTDGRFASAG